MHSLEQSGGLLSNADYLAFIRNKRDITLNGDRVKSTGEKFIADYLFEHDIPFFYERVEFWSGHSYRPDFTLFPETGQVIIEFWGIEEHDPKKSIPSGWGITWEQYHAEMEEKRAFWKEKEIPLVEMSVADIRRGREQFEQILNDRLAEVGIKNEKLSQKDLENKVIRNQKDRMTELFVQFIQRAKKRMWTVEEIQNKVREYKTNDERTRLFLNLGCQVYSAYQKALEKKNSIDFDDLIIKASELIRNSNGNCTLDLGPHKDRRIKIKDIEWILVDEFQDFSNEFNYILQAIFSQNPNAHLVCVGDDWQAINSFAGSDTTYFQQFSDHFQNGNIVNLLTNHRSQKAIVDFGNNLMIGRGEPGTSTADHLGGKVEIQTIDEIRIESREGISYENKRGFDQRFIFYEERENGRKINDNGFLQAKYLKACYQIIKEPNNWDLISKSKTNQPLITILSRTNYLYRVSLNEFLDKLKSCFTIEEMKIIGDFNHKIRISTVHGFKGLEAEIVIILRACDGSFPLLHPDNSLFEFFGQSEYQALEEERHLFYVGVSRPSQTLYILTEKGNESSFI
jgi:DNA helicase-4